MAAPLDTPLWAFSIAVYAAHGVADECLALQEHLNLDVNLLLFAAYVGAIEGIRLDASDLKAAEAVTGNWQREVIRPLRETRRALKPPSADAGNPVREAIAALRAQVKTAELQAEKIEQAMLWQWSQRELADGPRSDRQAALVGNVRDLIGFYGGDADMAASCLHKAAAAYPLT